MIWIPIGQRLERYRHGDDRQPDERNRLGVEAEVRAHRQVDAGELEGLLADRGRGARRCRRQDRIDALEQLAHFGLIPAAEFLRLDGERSRHHGGGDETVAHRRIEIVRALAHALEMQARAFDRGDQIGGRARERGLRNLDLVIGMQRRGDAVERDMRFRKQAFLEIAARDRDAQTVGAALERLGGRLDPRARRTPDRRDRRPA